MNAVEQASGAARGERTLTHDRIRAELLRMFRREIAQTLQPELTSSYARNVANLLVMMLDFMEDWASGKGYPEIDAARASLVGGSAFAAGEATPFLSDFDDHAGIDGVLAETISTAARGDNMERLTELIRGAAAIDDRLYTIQDQNHVTSRAEDRTLLTKIDIDLTADRFDRYAASKLDIHDDPTATVVKIPGGNSKDTFLIKLKGGREFIVRRDFPFGPTETSAPDEFDLLRRLHGLGFPVARPIAAERDRSYFGQPVLLVEKVEGEDGLAAAKADPKTGRFIAFELARLLAQLHRLDPAQLGFSAEDDDPRQQVANYLEYWRQWWKRNRIHSSSLGEAAFAWLERNVPRDIPRIVVVHGDPRPDNMLFEDGRVTALLDWEFAHPGDPAEDLQYAKGFVEPFVEWKEFLDAYMRAGGAPVSEEGARFYDVFRSLRNVVCTDVSWSGFVRRKYPAFKLASQGVIYKRMLAHSLAKSLLAVTD